MSVTRHLTKSCCGSRILILESNKAIRKSQIQIFRDAGFAIPENLLQAGVFYVQQGNLIATCLFGTNKINVRCNGPTCEQQLNKFEQLLNTAVNQ